MYLNTNSFMLTETTTIINKLGLHARAAGKLSKCANRFESVVQVQFGQRKVDAKSIMAVMMLAASQHSVIEVECDGPDEIEAMNAILALIQDRFEEEE